MDLLVAGLSHHTAPLALREKFALPPGEVPQALDRLVHAEGFPEGLILSTCNRTEIYARPGGADAAAIDVDGDGDLDLVIVRDEANDSVRNTLALVNQRK